MIRVVASVQACSLAEVVSEPCTHPHCPPLTLWHCPLGLTQPGPRTQQNLEGPCWGALHRASEYPVASILSPGHQPLSPPATST